MTELIWEGKDDGQGRKMAPPRIVLPFQTVETVNEPIADRGCNQDLFASGRSSKCKDRAARLWSENASDLSEQSWQYLQIPQAGFDKLQPTSFIDLAALTPTSTALINFSSSEPR